MALKAPEFGATIPVMFQRFREYLKFGAGRPPGTIWAMEKAYFDLRRKYPGREEHTYLRLALQSRYPNKGDEIHKLASECRSLDDAIVKAVALDFGYPVAVQVRMNVLWNLPACSSCRKYRALSTTDDLCYGCRNYAGFAACTKCHLFWDQAPVSCQQCGGRLWTITDGPGVPMIPLNDEPERMAKEQPDVPQSAADAASMAISGDVDDFVKLIGQVDALEARCERVWDASLQQRRAYRQLRRIDPIVAREFTRQTASAGTEDHTLVQDLDEFFDALCTMYLGAVSERRAEIRSLMESNKPLLGNLHNYAGRAANKLRETGSPEFLLRGLAAVSIDNDRSCQNYGFVLGQLYRNAAEHGFEPAAFFRTVAALSDNEMRGILENFEASEDFSLFVKPYLRGT